MNESEEQFLQKLKATFRIEAEEHLKALSNGILALENGLSPDKQPKMVEAIYREAHTLKGAARSVNLKSMHEVCQVFEDLLALWKRGQLKVEKSLYDTLYATLDFLNGAMVKDPEPEASVAILKKLKQSIIQEVKPEQTQPEASQPAQAQETQTQTTSDKLIRVSIPKLDRLLQEVEEMLMVKQAAQQEAQDLNQLMVEITAKEKELARLTQGQQIHSPQKMSDLIELHKQIHKMTKERLAKITKNSNMNAHIVEAMVYSLLEDIKKVLMQPVNILFDSFPRMVRDIAQDLGKEIKLEIHGGNIEVDRRILETLKDPIIHIIRNSIDHGIQSPDERAKQGRPRHGTITINAEEVGGSNVEISIADDGTGINVDKVKEASIKQNLLSAIEARDISYQDAIKLAFHSGVSTSTSVTHLSGRGLGLGIVSEKVEKLGGRIVVESEPNRGTKFRLILPLTLATFRGIRIQVSDQEYIVPAHNVINVMRLKQEDIHSLENCKTISIEGHSLSFIHLADMFGFHRKNGSLVALIIKGVDKTVAFGADGIFGEHEVLVKSLGSQCVRLKNVMAATIMESGKVIPILNPIDLIASTLKQHLVAQAPIETGKKESTKKVILFAEDSITTRLMIKNILETAGYEVKTAVDGAEALALLQTNKVDLLLTDIEMPNLDGFSLVQKIKATNAHKTLPVVICSACASREDREKGMLLGANAYLDKSSFTQQILLNLIGKLV